MAIQSLREFMSNLVQKNPGESEFHQAVLEVMEDVFPFIEEYPDYRDSYLLQRLVEPDRAITFRVPWQDDQGQKKINRGFRVQHCNTLGPYKGGLRFHPSVNLSIIKFLAFEQTFKNSLLPMGLGGAKGGSDFDPKGKSDHEILRFCQSFVTELLKYIGPRTDVPAGDIGVGEREIGFLYGQYKRMADDGMGVLTGKDPVYGGSLLRPEATGYGAVYFAQNMLDHRSEGLEKKVCSISGSGNVAIYAAEKLLELGARVITLSDSSGMIFEKNGFDEEKLSYLKGLKFHKKRRLAEAADYLKCDYYEARNPWHIPCDLAFPCATQNEIDENDAALLVRNGCRWVLEGANMPVEGKAITVFQEGGVVLAPGKASNSGGVAVSGLEMAQNATGIPWKKEKVDAQLREIMESVHKNCLNYGKEGSGVNYIKGANLSAFVRVAKSIQSQGF